jgi:hypothetical protein
MRARFLSESVGGIVSIAKAPYSRMKPKITRQEWRAFENRPAAFQVSINGGN